LADLEAAMDEFEKIRLAYVATTRARDHLIVSCHHKPGSGAAKSYGGIFWQVFDTDERRGLSRRFDWRQVVGSLPSEPARLAQLGLALDNREQWIADRQALLAPHRQPRVLSATGVAQAALVPVASRPVNHGSYHDDHETDTGQPETGDGLHAYVVERLTDQDDDSADQPDEGLIGRRRGRTGSAIGSAVHAVLQLVDLAEPQGVGDLVAQQCEIEGILDRTGIVRRLVQAALESSAVTMAAGHVHFKELFVTAPIAGRTIEGYVDLLVETPAGLVVIDYKTDSVRSDEDVDAKLGAYELQAAAYAVALEEVTAQTVSECRFVFCTAGGAIERAVVDLPAAKERVRLTLAQLTPDLGLSST